MERAKLTQFSFISVLIILFFSSCQDAAGIEGSWELDGSQYPMIRIETNNELVSKLMEKEYVEIKRLRNQDIAMRLNSRNRVKGRENNWLFGGAYTMQGDTLTMITVVLNMDTDHDRYMRDDTTVYMVNAMDRDQLQLSRNVKEQNAHIWSNPTIWKRMGVERPEDLEIFSEELIYRYQKN